MEFRELRRMICLELSEKSWRLTKFVQKQHPLEKENFSLPPSFLPFPPSSLPPF
jgi:hypothetical protein